MVSIKQFLKEFKREKTCFLIVPKFAAIGTAKNEDEIPREVQEILDEYVEIFDGVA